MGVEQIVMKFAQYSQSICSFDQGFLLKLDAAHAGSKGICYALSSCFILGCLSGKIPEDSFKIISDYNKLDTLVAIQKAYSDFNEDRAGISEEERDKINVEHTFHELMGQDRLVFLSRLYGEPVMKLSQSCGGSRLNRRQACLRRGDASQCFHTPSDAFYCAGEDLVHKISGGGRTCDRVGTDPFRFVPV